uniref:DUF2281 domain-containing protein n=1 Tax=Steinernema glaseri TaxID=37863 RepID=A0A1I7YI84_9BILA
MSSEQKQPEQLEPVPRLPRPAEDPSLERFIEIMRRLDRRQALSVDAAMDYWEDFDFPHFYRPESEPDEGIGSEDEFEREAMDPR